MKTRLNPNLCLVLLAQLKPVFIGKKPKGEDPRKIGGISWSDVFPVSSSDFLVFFFKS